MRSELAYVPSSLTFGQLLRGDANEAKKEIRRLLTKGGRRGSALVVHIDTRPQGLRLVPVRKYGTKAKALLDSGATQNLISPELVSELSISPEPTVNRYTVDDGSNSLCTGTLEDTRTSFGDATVL